MNLPHGPFPAWAFGLAYALLVPSLLLLASWWGGFAWRTVARVYPHRGKFPKETCFRNASILNYSGRNGATLGVSEYGLHIQALWALRAGMPSIFIPWKDLAATPDRNIFGAEVLELSLRKLPDVNLQIVGIRGGDWLIKQAASRLQVAF